MQRLFLLFFSLFVKYTESIPMTIVWYMIKPIKNKGLQPNLFLWSFFVLFCEINFFFVVVAMCVLVSQEETRIVFLQKKTDVSPLFVVRNIKMSLNEISN